MVSSAPFFDYPLEGLNILLFCLSFVLLIKNKLIKYSIRELQILVSIDWEFGDVADVKWNRINFYDEATFMKDGKETKAFYDFDSNLVGTTHEVTFADLPENAQKEFNKQYKDYVIGRVIYFDNNNSN